MCLQVIRWVKESLSHVCFRTMSVFIKYSCKVVLNIISNDCMSIGLW